MFSSCISLNLGHPDSDNFYKPDSCVENTCYTSLYNALKALSATIYKSLQEEMITLPLTTNSTFLKPIIFHGKVPYRLYVVKSFSFHKGNSSYLIQSPPSSYPFFHPTLSTKLLYPSSFHFVNVPFFQSKSKELPVSRYILFWTL